ncbi:ATP-binding protein [Yinghuangia sp. ASG 101]|uniref:SCO6881 family protein n=1 Tax=Yinghuangia sp. ASG 101 TaxID=2896848 RepID=UPI001E3EA158|nr:ATP-binding protein [Yinghuangia sp. ASG 101]UGQ10945.1 ATP-binding protein [Yinghuangia sp. ASG 101]
MSVCETPLIDAVCAAVGGLVSATGEAITNAVGAWIAQSMAELAGNSADLAARAVDATTRVDLNAAWFRENYELLLPIGLVLLVATFCAQLVRAAVRRDEQALSQAVSGTVIGIAFQFGAIAFTSVALTVVDALSTGLWTAGGTNVEASVRRIIQVSTFGAMFPLGWAVVALIAFACSICMFIYWGIMVFRKVAILILVTLAVFAGAGGGWEAARRWRRGWVEATATLVVSKLLMTVVFLLGVTAMGRSDTSDGLAALSDAMAGIVVMCLVLCCPLITFKFVHWACETADGQDLTLAAGAGAQYAYGVGRKTARGSSKATSGAPQGPDSVPGADSKGVATGIPSPDGPTPNPSSPSPPGGSDQHGSDHRDTPGGRTNPRNAPSAPAPESQSVEAGRSDGPSQDPMERPAGPAPRGNNAHPLTGETSPPPPPGVAPPVSPPPADPGTAPTSIPVPRRVPASAGPTPPAPTGGTPLNTPVRQTSQPAGPVAPPPSPFTGN